jgi:hypothetical protein
MIERVSTWLFVIFILFTVAYFVGQWVRAIMEGTLPL